MVNGQKEIWVKIDHDKLLKSTIIAVSNCGRVMRHDGSIEIASLRQRVNVNKKIKHLYQILLEFFMPKSEDDIIKGRKLVDHKTHYPKDMYVNDVRNLRWCTNKENCNFEEVKETQRKKSSERLKGKHRFVKNSFGDKYYEKYHLMKRENTNLYQKELRYYRKFGFCSWEN